MMDFCVKKDRSHYMGFAKLVIETELNAIQNLLPRINIHFVSICEQLANTRGKIILMGMGKSGHIARKIAATLSSTGTPAIFLHPAEAQHGDIGIISSDDAAMLFSNSGETEEFKLILPYLKALAVPIIALTGNKDSMLAKFADFHIDVSVNQEACPLGLAPTASTTAALVMGDALAMTVLQFKGFSKEDFARTHPSGRLGKRLLLTVGQLMHSGPRLPMVEQTTSIKNSLLEITNKKLGMAVVVNAMGECVGIFTDGDLRRTLDNDIVLQHTSIQDFMTRSPKTISSNTLAYDALQMMYTHKITALVIVENKQPVGVIHIHDILNSGVI